MSTTNSGWTQAAIVAGNAAVQGYTARQAAKEQKKVSQAAAQPRYEYQVRNPYMNELIAPLIPYILQSQQQVFQNRMKGYGSSAPDFSPFANLLAGITSNYSGVPQMGGGQTYGGNITSSSMPSSFPRGGYPNGDSVSPQMRAQIEETKANYAKGFRPTTGKGSGSGGIRAHGGIQRRTDSVFDGSGGVAGIGGGGGSYLDVLMSGRDPNYFRMMLGDSFGRIDAGNADMSNSSLDPNLRGETWGQSGAGLSPQDMWELAQRMKYNKGVSTAVGAVNQFNPLGFYFSLASKYADTPYFEKMFGVNTAPNVVPGFMTGNVPGSGEYNFGYTNTDPIGGGSRITGIGV